MSSDAETVRYLTVKEVAKMAYTNEYHIRQLNKQGKLHGVKITPKLIVFNEKEVEHFLAPLLSDMERSKREYGMEEASLPIVSKTIKMPCCMDHTIGQDTHPTEDGCDLGKCPKKEVKTVVEKKKFVPITIRQG